MADQPPTQTSRESEAESVVRNKARQLLLLAGKPALITVGPNKVQEDTARADREAQNGGCWSEPDEAVSR